jgi:2-dehydro-3-deoxygluconokinase
MTRFDVTTIGEIMLRYSVPAGQRLETANVLDVHPAGAEGNLVAVLSRLGWRCGLVTSLPNNPLGRLAANHLRMSGMDLDGVVWSDAGRMGTYYVEFAVPPRPIQVTYDRANSCAAQLSADQIDWNHLLDARLVHLTGITVALSTACHSLVAEAVDRAKAAGVAVSFDINYRSKLWSPEEAASALRPMIQSVEVLFCKQADARTLFGCEGSPEEIVRQLSELSGAQHVVMTLGDQGVIGWDGTQILRESAVPVQMIDRLGAGDALAAGVLHGWLDGNFARGLRYGVVLAALALSQHGDMVVTTAQDLESLVKNLPRSEDLIR